jgi:hypothetical protein
VEPEKSDPFCLRPGYFVFREESGLRDHAHTLSDFLVPKAAGA